MNLRISLALVAMASVWSAWAAAQTTDCDIPSNPFTNCGFESGDFSGWITQDLTEPFSPLDVVGPGVDVSRDLLEFFSAPTEGDWTAVHGFDGSGPGVIVIAQDITVPGNPGPLQFDYRSAWNLDTFFPLATRDRNFRVEVQPTGGGAALATFPILTATAGTTELDTGNQSGSVNLGAFAGQSVRVAFVWDVPEYFSGPAAFQLDAVGTRNIPTPVPVMGPLTLTALLLGALGLGAGQLRRSRRA